MVIVPEPLAVVVAVIVAAGCRLNTFTKVHVPLSSCAKIRLAEEAMLELVQVMT